MPKQQPRNSLKPLSVGNVVTAAIQLFRSHLKQYLGLTLQAYLWALVPIYGWAKFYMIAAMISRLAFGDLSGQPESEAQVRQDLEGKKWSFLGLAFLVGLIFGGVIIAWYIAIIIMVAIGVVIVAAVGQDNVIVIGVLVIVFTLLVILSLFGLTWFSSRLVITEPPLAIESLPNAAASISRSWELTKGYVLRIQGILIIAFLMTLPLQIITQVLAFLAQLALGLVFDEDSSLFLLFSLLAGYAIGLGSTLFVFPFWQAIKAVIYFDVRNRKEGLGLELRDRAL